MGEKPKIPESGPIESVELKHALEERYLAYALSTIMHRALPDVRDGMKPVHRRLLYAMRLLKLEPQLPPKKSARVVGDVIGKFHPHGDQSVYDALVRLAQDFAVRYPLVDGQGNFGNIDGDNPAAMRYTEARLTDTAVRILAGIDEDAVDFRPTYDGSEEEPVVMPAAFPNLLANGSNGIAVGMATSVPPHNVFEVVAAARMLVDDRNTSIDQLLTVMPGPDFPTGGVIVDQAASIREAYMTGRGSFRVRARWTKEEGARGSYQIVITEIPFQVQKSRLLERLGELVNEKKVIFLEDIRDESTEDVRVVIEPKSRNVDPNMLMETLFKLTELEARVPLNMNVLAKNQVPMVMNLREVILAWLDHRRDVLIRRSRFRLGQIERRLEILGGLLVAYLNLDEVIRIIREEDEPKPVLMERFSINEVQANAILDTRLRSLRKLEEMELKRENDALTAEREALVDLLDSEKKQWKTISGELADLSKAYDPKKAGCARRTTFDTASIVDVSLGREALVEKEPLTVVLSKKGWIRTLKGHNADLSALLFKEGDQLLLARPASTTDQLVLVATNGKFFTLDPTKLPGGRGHGEPVRLMIDMEQTAEILDLFVHKPGRKLLLASGDARGFVVLEDEVVANTRKGKQVLVLDEPDQLKILAPVHGDMVAAVGDNRKMLLFALSDVPEMSRGKGVRLQRFKDGGLADVRTYAKAEGMTWLDGAGRTFKLDGEAEYLGERGAAGRLVPRGFPRETGFGPKVW